MKTKAVTNQDILNVSRRGFLKSGAAAAGGLVLGFHFGAEEACRAGRLRTRRRAERLHLDCSRWRGDAADS